MKRFLLLMGFVATIATVTAQENDYKQEVADSVKDVNLTKSGRLTVGGYGEAVFNRAFYSDNYKRYSYPESYADDKGYGQVDIPHFVIFLSYDFGKGWSFTSEIEFEHGGVGSAVEIEAEETGEYESEIEKGGEVVLEQFYIQKHFSDLFNLRIGHMVVPVGYANSYHLPTQFFTNDRPESGSSIIPNTWHETGIALTGRGGDWHYEIQLIAGLDADRFSDAEWVGGSGVSPYEFKMATNWAGAMRVDNYSIKGLRVGVSGYIGKSANNTLTPSAYKDIDGWVSIGSADFEYNDHNVILRGDFLYGNLTDNKEISVANKSLRDDAPSAHSDVAKTAISCGVEGGYNIFGLMPSLKEHKLYLFGRYEYYDSMYDAGAMLDLTYYERNKATVGINYFPIPEVVVKAEYSSRTFPGGNYNTENTFSLGIAFSGFFK
ncbi:MAG: hypothetical protein R3Y49_03855 [Rikenellaceae bacterium]